MPEKNKMSSRRQEASGKAEVGGSPSREGVWVQMNGGVRKLGKFVSSEEGIKSFAVESGDGKGFSFHFYSSITIWLTLWLSNSTIPSEVLCIVL